MIYPLVTDLAADGLPVAVTCRVLGFSKQGYHRWKTSPVTERDWIDAHRVNAARDIHADDPAFGYRFIADELPEKGITAGENRVQRLCRDHGIWSVFSKKRGLNRKPGPPVHDDLVERDFAATSLVHPVAIARQNARSVSRRSDGFPGDFITGLPVNAFIQPAGLPIATSRIEVLRRPVESVYETINRTALKAA